MLKRHILSFITESFLSFPVIMLIGARQVGKSTLLEEMQSQGLISHIATLDDLTTLDAVERDPYGYLKQFEHPIAIDEVQRFPRLMLAIKQIVDETKKPGQFVLTGSANLLSYPHFHESLAGRADIISIEGLSGKECAEQEWTYSWIDDAFVTTTINILVRHFTAYVESKKQLAINKLVQEGIFFGSYPNVRLTMSDRFRERWFSSYEMAYIERDVRDLSKNLDIIAFGKLFRVMGCQTGQLLNYANLAGDCMLDQRTVKRYVEFLQMTFQATLLLPWHTNLTHRMIKTPKVYLNDVGHATFIQGINTQDELKKSPSYGHLFESWVFSELRKHLHSLTGYKIAFFRTHSGKEIDFIIYKGQKLLAIECKAKMTLQHRDAATLISFVEEIPHALGIIIYSGQHVVKIHEKIIAVPIAILF